MVAGRPEGRLHPHRRRPARSSPSMNPDGSGIEAVTPDARARCIRAGRPTAKRILYCTDDDLHPPVKNEAQIYVDRPGDEEDHHTDLRRRQHLSGDVARTARRIAYRHMIGEMNSEVFVADADGSHVRNLTNHPSFEGWPAWSPDGQAASPSPETAIRTTRSSRWTPTAAMCSSSPTPKAAPPRRNGRRTERRSTSPTARPSTTGVVARFWWRRRRPLPIDALRRSGFSRELFAPDSSRARGLKPLLRRTGAATVVLPHEPSAPVASHPNTLRPP